MAQTSIQSIEWQTRKLLRELESLTGEQRKCNIEIPGGITPTVNVLKQRYAFVSDKTLLRNITYAIQSMVFYRWILRRFYLFGPIKSYLIKTGIVLTFMIVEGLMRDFIKQKGESPRDKTIKNIKLLRNQYYINPTICDRIKKLHDRRSNIHLHLVTDLEHSKYTTQDWNHSIALLNDFVPELRTKLSI